MALVIAHRGASGHAPEHTLAAYDLALDQGADALELDVRVTADRELVLVHDATLERTTGDPRRVEELTLAELAALDHPARPVALGAVLARYGRRTRWLVDLKDPRPAWEGLVVEAIERHGLRDRATLQSFDLDALARLARIAPGVPLAALYRRAASLALDVDAVPAFAAAVGPWHGVVDEALAARAALRGLRLHPWTVNDRVEARRLLALGVAGLITDVPDVVVEARPRAVAAVAA